MVDWLVEKIARWEVDRDLPKSRTKYGWQDPSQRTEQSWCASVADSAREFSETGLIVTSLTQCSHYMHCQRCNVAFPELEKQFRRFETTLSSQCHELLRLLGVCVERALPSRQGGIVGQGDQFAWRAIVCGAGLTYFDSIREFSRILSGLKRGAMLEPGLQQILDLNKGEIHLLSFAEAASWPFIEMQWFLYGNDELIYLPSDGDLWEIPGAVVVLTEPEIGEWKRLMTGSDLEFPKRDGRGRESTLVIDGLGLFIALNAAAALEGGKLTAALDSMRGVREIEGPERRPLPTIDSADTSLINPRLEGLGQTLLDSMREMRDLVASNSAAQFEAIQSIRSRIDRPTSDTAETSLRQQLGDELYKRLSPVTRTFLITAELHSLDENRPSPSSIVFNLGAAFENQLRETIFKPFGENLLSLGIRDYPEPPGPPLSLVAASSSVRPPSRLHYLLKYGRLRDLTLGDMQQYLERGQPRLLKFLAQYRFRVQDLIRVLPEISSNRNGAAHRAQPSSREEALFIRDRWLGKTEDFPNIFAVLMPDNTAGRPTSAP
jgi:hypothetical protein